MMDDIRVKTVLGQSPFLFVKIKCFGGRWHIREDEKAVKCDRERNYTIDYEQPPPSASSVDALEMLVNGCLKHTGEQCPS
jgi:hypothetical protein